MIYIELFIGGTLKNNVESRAKKRKRERKEKETERANDTNSDRGFSTDQKITMDHNEILRAKLKHQQGETQGIFLIAQEQALGRQIDSAERRATQRCKDYDSTNPYWKTEDDLLTEQQSINKQLRDQSAAMQADAMTINVDEGGEKANSKNNSSTNSTKVMDMTGTSIESDNDDDDKDSLNDNVSN